MVDGESKEGIDGGVMSDKLRAAAKAALETLEDVFGKDKIDVGAINNLRAALAEPDIKESLTNQRPWVAEMLKEKNT